MNAVIAPLRALLGRVPLPALRPEILVGAGSFAAVVLLVAVASFLFAPSTPATAAKTADAHAPAAAGHGEEDEDDHAVVVPLPTRPRPTATPVLPTPTPLAWEERDRALFGYGWEKVPPPGDSPRASTLFFDEREPPFRISATVTILTASGENAPWFGIMLSYKDPLNYVVAESYKAIINGKSFMGLRLHTRTNGTPNTLIDDYRIPDYQWGREAHRLVVKVVPADAKQMEASATLDGKPTGKWRMPKELYGGRLGLWVGGNNRVKFEDVTIE